MPTSSTSREMQAVNTAVEMVPTHGVRGRERNADASTSNQGDAFRTASSGAEQDAAAVVRRWFHFVSLRDANAMTRLLSDDCRHFDLGAGPESGKDSALHAYRRFFDTLPEDAAFVVEDVTCGNSNKVGVIWHMQLAGHRLPNAHGVSWFTVDPSSRICYIRESPVHFIRSIEVVLPILSAAAPFLKAGMPMLLPTIPPPSLPLFPNLAKFAPQPEAVFADVGQQLAAWLPTPFVEEISTQSPPSSGTSQRFSFTEDDWRHVGVQHSDVPATFHTENVPSCQTPSRDQVGGGSVSNGLAVQTVSLGFGSGGGQDIAMRELVQMKPSTSTSRFVQSQPSTQPRPLVPTVRTAESQRDVGQVPRASPSEVSGNMSGLWKKIPGLSDTAGYGRALDLLGVGGIQKATAMMIDGMEVEHTGNSFAVFYLTVVPYFKVKEAYKFDAQVSQGRRDMRSGRQKATAQEDETGSVIVDITWTAPNPGSAHEEYWLNAAGQLCAESTVTVNGKSETTLQVYARQNAGQVDKRYYGAKQNLPFGIDPNSISADLVAMFK